MINANTGAVSKSPEKIREIKVSDFLKSAADAGIY